MRKTRKCAFCGKEFTCNSGSQRYCSEQCAEAAKAQRKKKQQDFLKAVQPVIDIASQEYLTFSKAAILMGCSRQYVYKLVNEGKLPASRISSRMAFVRKADIEMMLAGNPYHRVLPTYKPMNLKLLGERNFGVSMAVLAVFGIGMLGGTYLLPLYMQKGLGYTAIMAGSVFLPVGLIQGVLSTCSGFLTRYIKPLFIAVTGILVMTLSFYFASRFTLHTTHAQIMLVLYLRGFGMGLTFAPLNDFSLMNLSQRDMASAAGISNSIKQLSGSVSIALLTVILTGRTAFHSAQGGLSSAESYVAGISDDFLFVTFVSLASALPFLWLLRPRRKAASFKSEGTGT